MIRSDDKAGCRLAWEYFLPDREAHWVIDYVEDWDLWRKSLSGVEEVNLVLESYPRSFSAWNALFGKTAGALQRQGMLLVNQRRQIIAQARSESERVVSWGLPDGRTVRIPIVNMPAFRSTAGQRMREDYPDAPFVALYYQRGDGRWKVSLRSADETDDVRQIAEQFPGGGGVRNAAGFEVDTLPWL